MREDRRPGPEARPPGAEGGTKAILALVDALRPLDADRTALLHAASHRLRTPLTSLVGFVELLADGTIGPITAEQRQVLETVSRSAAQLLTLVDALEPR